MQSRASVRHHRTGARNQIPMAIKTQAQTIEEETKTKQKHKMDRAHQREADRAIKMPGAN
jgi:hypothetical protein